MDTNPLPESSSDNRIESKRAIIREYLSEIILDVERRLRAAAVSVPIFLTVPFSGDAMLTMASPLDPSDAEWADVVEIVCEIVSERLNGLKLRSRDMICATASTAMSAADLTTD